MWKTEIKPPLGLIPRHVWRDKRICDIREACFRYFRANQQIPSEWITEHNDLMKEV